MQNPVSIMLNHKEIHNKINNANLLSLAKNGGKIIPLKKPAIPAKKIDKTPATPPVAKKHKLPPRDKFNSGYIKGRDNDPL